MKKIVLLMALVCLIPLSFAQEHAFLVSFSYDLNSDSFSFNSVKIIDAENIGYDKGSEEGYSLKLFNEKESHEIKFQPYGVIYLDLPSKELFDENGEQIYFPTIEETIQVKEKTEHAMLLPYLENAEMQIMDDKGKTKLKINLQEEVEKQFSDMGKEPQQEKMPLSNQALFGVGLLLILLIIYSSLKKISKRKK